MTSQEELERQKRVNTRLREMVGDLVFRVAELSSDNDDLKAKLAEATK